MLLFGLKAFVIDNVFDSTKVSSPSKIFIQFVCNTQNKAIYKEKVSLLMLYPCISTLYSLLMKHLIHKRIQVCKYQGTSSSISMIP